MKIAIVGTGIAGLSAAHVLARAHEVELYEAADRVGGHTHTVDVDGLAIDTGFIVHNVANYPLLTRLFRELGVTTQPSVMSFSMTCGCGRVWSSRRPQGAGRLLPEILRFLRTAGTADAEGKDVATFLRDEGYSDDFRRHYLVPMTSALWSTAPGDALTFPAAFAIQFFRNHGMLGLRRRRWRTVVGGSREYVRRIEARLERPVRLACPVQTVARDADGVALRLADGSVARHDAAVVATHAPTALALLERPTKDEQRLLGAFAVTENETVLHTDERLLPSRARDRAAWNVFSARCGDDGGAPTVTYSLSRLQSLPDAREWCVTLNRTAEIDPAKIVRVLRYAHPRMTFAALDAQRELHRLNVDRLAFAGAWQSFGFHEDGIRSGAAAASSLGVRW
ncbi:MAG: NAD(P)/FAD-dependent oxidoreductase [Gaiella sp.]